MLRLSDIAEELQEDSQELFILPDTLSTAHLTEEEQDLFSAMAQDLWDMTKDCYSLRDDIQVMTNRLNELSSAISRLLNKDFTQRILFTEPQYFTAGPRKEDTTLDIIPETLEI